MPPTHDPKHPALTLIPGKRLSLREFTRLPGPDKLPYLRQVPHKERLDLVLEDPAGTELLQALSGPEFTWLVAEIGHDDAQELLALAAPEQVAFLLDWELWEKGAYAAGKGYFWLEQLVALDEGQLLEIVHALDLELLLLLLGQELLVGGGVGELLSDEERLADWDHTFDNCYFLTFRIPSHGPVVGRLLDILFRFDENLYRRVLEGLKNEVDAELEELCCKFRSGRLADQGFPSREDALAIYGRLEPADYAPSRDKEPFTRPLDDGSLPLLATLASGTTLLHRALAAANAPALAVELQMLLNNALVVEDAPLSDREAVLRVCQRVTGYLNIALEHLVGDQTEAAAALLQQESLRRLFQLGFGIIRGLRRQARDIGPTEHPSSQLLEGLRQDRPLFYRGLDPDRADGFREFRDLADIRTLAAALERLAG